MARKRKKKRKRFVAFIFFLLLISAAIYGGIKFGEYYANKLSKPIEQGGTASKNPLDGIDAGGKVSSDDKPSEDEVVKQVSRVSDFLIAEHKKSSSLAELATADYYKVLLKELKVINIGDVTIRDIDFKENTTSHALVNVKFMKYGKIYEENITMVTEDGKWKVSGVER